MTDTNEITTGTQEEKSGWTIKRIAMITSGVLIGLILLVFLAGVLLALLTDVDQTAPRVQVIRDIFIIILAFQGILIVAALAVLILQVARLINLLQNEVMPILENTKETVNTAKGTVEFVGSNLAGPVIRLNGFMSAVLVILRDVFGIRRAIKRSNGRDRDHA